MTLEVNKRTVGKTVAVTRSREDWKKAPLMWLSSKKSKTKRYPSESTWSWSVAVRQMQLVVTAKNTAIKPMPEGQLEWSVLVEKVYGGVERYHGTGILPALRSLQSQEVLLGPVPVGETRTAGGLERDNVEYEIIVTHDGEETFRVASCGDFAQLDAVAKQRLGWGEGVEVVGRVGDQPAVDLGGGRKDVAKVNGSGQPPPGSGEGDPPPAISPMPVEIQKPRAAATPVSTDTFDFFNLGEQKSAAAN